MCLPAAVRRVAKGLPLPRRKGRCDQSEDDLCIHCLVGGVMNFGCSVGRGRRGNDLG